MGDIDAELRGLATEQARADLADLDTRDVRALVRQVTAEDATVATAVAAAEDAITAAAAALVERIEAGGRLIYVGAGTPGRLAVLDAAELSPTYGFGADRVIALLAGGSRAVAEATEGVEDDEEAARRDLASVGVRRDDVVVGITASGRTPYVLAAMSAAREAGAATVGIANNADSALSGLVDHPIEVPTGPEVVAGSTRMKAGTAQKLVLNTLSTVAMIRLGKVYGNRMVDMRATNEKLRLRARRIVVEVTGADEATAAAALEEAEGQVKVALVAILAGVGADEARARLNAVHGRVRAALADGRP